MQLVTFFAFGCSTSLTDDPLSLASGSGGDPFGSSGITLSDFENGEGQLTIAPSNYSFTYPTVAALPEYDVYLYELGDDPVAEIYAYNATVTPGSGSTGSDFESICTQDYEEFLDPTTNTIAQVCHNTGETCHIVEGTSGGTSIVVRCPKE